jgi:hypothetical protein
VDISVQDMLNYKNSKLTEWRVYASVYPVSLEFNNTRYRVIVNKKQIMETSDPNLALDAFNSEVL